MFEHAAPAALSTTVQVKIEEKVCVCGLVPELIGAIASDHFNLELMLRIKPL